MNSGIVHLFEKVQKIPYRVCKFDKNEINESLQYGDCRHKCELLYRLLKKEGVIVKKMKVIFDWKDLPIPGSLLLILNKSGTIFLHDSLMVKNGRKWIKVDCTWNQELETKGFPITKNWDGKSDTKLVTEGKLTYYELDKYPKINIVREEAMQFAEELNKFLSF